MAETFEAYAELARFLEQAAPAIAIANPAEAVRMLLLASFIWPEVRT